MLSRPVILPLIVLICGIIAVDCLVPTFIIGEHYSLHFDKAQSYRYKIKQENKTSERWHSYKAEVTEYFDGKAWQKTSGEVILYVPATENSALSYGDRVESSANMQRIENFAQADFDYQRYMRHKRLYHNVFTRDYKVEKGREAGGVMYWANRTKTCLTRRLTSSDLSPENSALAVSLLLGDKRGLDEDMKMSFSVSGLAHVLCVSGLHVGLIIAMFDLLFRNLHFLGLRGFYLRRLLLILTSWVIAFIVGCTPSALRVALMLSLTLLTGTTAYRSDGLNVLLVTAFLLFLCDPLLLFDVSFQLSFLAVLGIMLCMPRAEKWIRTKVHPWLRGICRSGSVTLSAQLLVLPIIVFRFGNFPLLFLIANLLVVPFMGVILFTIILLLILTDVPFVGEITAQILTLELSFLKAAAHYSEEFTNCILSMF